MSLGIVGVGGLSFAIVSGLCESPGFMEDVVLSPRNAEKAAELARKYGQVRVAASNQEVLDACDTILVTVLPKNVEEVLRELRFRPDHHAIHVAAAMRLERVMPLFAPATRVARGVPLPFAARRIGPTVLFGADERISGLFAHVGEVVNVATERELEILATITALMVPYYGLVKELVDWGAGKGLDAADGIRYTASMYEALSVLMRERCTPDMEAFLAENTTPGGMNEYSLGHIRERGGYAPWVESLETVGKKYGL